MANHYALVIGNSLYENLTQLMTPARDADAIVRVLTDPVIGDYEVQLELNQDSAHLRKKIDVFFRKNSKKDNTVLFYFSGHGEVNDAGELHLTAKDTDPKHLSSTSISAQFLRKIMEDCSAQRKIIILDSCHSGAFTKGFLKGGMEMARRARTELGSGMAILTSSRPLQYAFEASEDEARGLSIFTRFLVEGLETGAATGENQDFITVNDIHKYVEERMNGLDGKGQKPRISTIDKEGDIILAYNKLSPRFALPSQVENLLKINQPTSLRQAIPLLQQQICSQDKDCAKRAIGELQKLANHDIQMVSSQAGSALKQVNISLQLPAIRFSDGKAIQSVREWVYYVEQHKKLWLEASELLYSGLIEKWLKSLNRSQLLTSTKSIIDKFPNNRLIGLEHFQRAAGGERISQQNKNLSTCRPHRSSSRRPARHPVSATRWRSIGNRWPLPQPSPVFIAPKRWSRFPVTPPACVFGWLRAAASPLTNYSKGRLS